ncbi:restriction endonuclease [[Clostridium] colinum]|uniref:restriction endonuclease n=1 Tax=[Clostridium] colinum TaxID=36835 RepID=UPI0020246022|nr:restriction endonuclease [[Clostridium] colinum]
MNIWTEKSIELANQKNYLDLLFKIYPMSINLKRELDKEDTNQITKAFYERDSEKLLEVLLSQEIFPIKDSYVAYLKRDKTAIKRNPNTVQRLTGMLYEMGLAEIFDKTTVPKETNRQIGPLFKKWIDSGALGCKVTSDENEFLYFNDNIIFNSSDISMKNFANKYLGYNRNKGLDFIAKFNNVFILAEAKFLTDFGGHQNAQFEDAISTMKSKLIETNFNVKIISVLDGVLFIKSKNKMYTSLCTNFTDNDVIISAVLLRDYLFSL